MPCSVSDEDLRWIPAQTCILGSNAHYAEEAPAHRVVLDGFGMQTHQVTNTQFAEFITATGYLTVAERPLDPADFPGAPAQNLQPSGPTAHQVVVDLDPGRVMAPSRGTRIVDRQPGGSPGGPCRVRGRRRLRRLGRAVVADRSGVGDRRAGGYRAGRLHLGR